MIPTEPEAPNPAVEFREVQAASGQAGIQLWQNGVPLTTPLFDHPGLCVGYRYVDVFHLAHAVALGWSPNTSKMLRRDHSGNEQHTLPPPPDIQIEDSISVLTLTYASGIGPD